MPGRDFLESLSLGRSDLGALASLKVLAADDHAYNREVLRCLLELVGVGVDIVVDGVELVSSWEIGCYDLVLTDVQMPHMNGMAAARTIRGRERALGLGRIPIIAVTSTADEFPLETFRKAGFDAVVPKPIVPRRLFEAILRASDMRTGRRARWRSSASHAAR